MTRFDPTTPLEPFTDHPLYTHALREVRATWRLVGPEAAKRKANAIADAFTDAALESHFR